MSDQLKDLFAQAAGADEKSLRFLMKALSENDLSGFDYLQFKQSVAALAKMNMDEATAYKSAFATAATMGLTKAKLAETAGYYRNILVKEQDNFAKALNHQLSTKVEAKKKNVEKLKYQINKNKEQIKKLQDEIAGYLDEVESMEASIVEEDNRIAAAKDKFENTHKAVLRVIDEDVANIEKYLGAEI
ncbi:MAG TPA: hypothetical protein ENK85_06815 [Saprospiraceae bacterium]|nr:hypothetical protein [Saprospiraceae bacterium]